MSVKYESLQGSKGRLGDDDTVNERKHSSVVYSG